MRENERAVSGTHQVTTRAGRIPAKSLVTRVPRRAWQRLSADVCAKPGPQLPLLTAGGHAAVTGGFSWPV
ncbi:hypothetical protein GCM10010517_55780 [Streptosporangium fragile]|uniref:DUF397 domain-containing protein n=1 Tax=Streptosporangium fragile TaxID=46186 RepID=A0ABP6IML0_9ACTN